MILGVLMLTLSIGLGSLISASAYTYGTDTLYFIHGSGNAKSNQTTNGGALVYISSSNTYVYELTTTGSSVYFHFSTTTTNDNNIFTGVSNSDCISDSYGNYNIRENENSITQFINQSNNNHYSLLIYTNATCYIIFDKGTWKITATTTKPDGYDAAASGGETPDPDPEPTSGGSGSLGTKVTSGSNLDKILKETDIAVYLYGYTGNDNNQSLSTSSKNYKEGTNITNDYSFIQIAKTDLSSYYYITNHKGDWEGNQNYDLKTATNGGAVYDGRNSYTSSGGTKDAAKTGSTSITNGNTFNTFYNANNLNISTSVNSTTMSYSSDALQLCYYVKDSSDNFYELTDMTGLEVSAANTAQTYSVSLAGFAAGSYTLYTVAKSGSRNLWYILDKDDTFTVTAVDTETIRSNLIIFNNNSSSAIVRGWLWKDSGSGTNKNFTTKGTYSSKALSYYNNSSTGYNKGIGFTSSASEGGTWVGTGQVTGDITDGSVSTDGNRYYYNSSTSNDNGSWTAFAHIGDTIALDNSTVGVGDTVKISNTITGTLFDGSGGATSASVTYYYINNADNTITTIGTDANATNSTKKSFSINTAGTYTVVAYVSDQWGFEKAMTNVATLTVVPTYEVAAQTNNAIYGTVSVSDATAYSGQEITVTTSEKSGTLSEVKITKTSDGSDVTSSVSYNSSTKKFTMPAYAVTVKATFTAYSGDSNFYYNGYSINTTNTTATIKSGYYGERMSEAQVGGSKFAYYHVTGRGSETYQAFCVSKTNMAYSNDTRVYFTRPSWGDNNDHWSNWDSQYVMFYSSDGQCIRDWTAMTGDGSVTGGYQFYATIPYGAYYAQFKDGYKQHTSTWCNLSNGDGGTYNNKGFYLTGTNEKNGNDYKTASYNVNDGLGGVPLGAFEYYYGTNLYDSATFSTGAFNNYNAGYNDNSNSLGSHSYPRPTTMGDAANDYYVIALYDGNTYTINDTTATISNGDGKPTIIWMSELPEGVEDKIPVYAKDGAVSDKTSTTASDLSIGQQIADTAISGAGLSGLTTETYYQKAKADVGSEITITTTIKNTTKAVSSTESENLRDLYYVKAFSINGMCYSLNEWNSSGVYTTKYTVQPTDTYVEITPIFFLKDSSNCTTFYLDGYTDEIKNSGWGETLYVYPFYTDPDVSDDDVSGGNNAFGKYPGQPVINYGGKYYTQVPMSYYTTDEKSHTKECTVEGVVISNGYSDIVHSTDLGKYNGVTSHKQTYDFKDFYTIKVALKPDRIIYTFKYRSGEENNNPSPSSKESRSSVTSSLHASESSYTGTHSSEFLKDTHGRYVDIFGKVLSTQPTNEPDSGYLSVYSVGYVQNASGNYATEWVVYDTSGNIIKYSDSDKSIIPAALYFSSSSQLSSYGLGDYVNMYNTLNNDSYKNKPVKICYEQEIEIDSAKRSDGVWLHSSDNDVISANIKIQYMASGSSVYVDDSMSYDSASGTSSGSTTGAKAYFTNTDTNKAGETYNGNYQTGDLYSSSSKNFTFTAESNGNYIFQGWYRVNTSGAESLVATENDGSSDMTSSDTYIARFKYVTSGALNLSASMTSAYTGLGTAKIGVDVLNSSDEVKKTYELGTSAITVPSTYIKSDSTYKLRVTLQTVASGDYRFNAFSSTAAATFFGGTDSKSTTNYTDDTGTRTFTFNVSDLYTDTTQNVLSLAYTSTLDKGTAYTVEYNYTGLGGASKTYTTKAYSFENITNGTNVTKLTVGNRGTTFQEWVTNHVPAVDNKDYDQTWTIGTLTYTNNKISLTAASNARTYTVIEDIDGVTSTASGLAKNVYSSGTRTLTCTEALKSEFKYWSVHNLTKTGTKGNIEMARCYSYDFTLQLTGDSYISLETVSDDSNPALLSDPTYSREIYTDGESTVDKVYVDFILAYMNKEISLKEDELESNTYRSGIIVEFNENTTVSSAYNGETFISDNDQVRSFAKDNAANSIYNAEGQSGRNAMVRFTADDSNYNNFNRLDYRLGFNNNTSWMTRVMKAYYYVTDGTNVYLSDPVYFCLYDTSVAVYEQ